MGTEAIEFETVGTRARSEGFAVCALLASMTGCTRVTLVSSVTPRTAPYRTSFNQVEGFFCILAKQSPRNTDFPSKKQLRDHIKACVVHWNNEPTPFTWTKEAAIIRPADAGASHKRCTRERSRGERLPALPSPSGHCSPQKCCSYRVSSSWRRCKSRAAPGTAR